MHLRTTPEEVAGFRAAYDGGMSIEQIQADTGRSPETIYRWLRKTGGTRGNVGSHPSPPSRSVSRARALDEIAFHRPLTPETAWVLGLAFGNGNVRPGGRFQIACNAKDVDVCHKVAAALRADATISANAANCYVVEVYSKRMVRDLATRGVVPNKCHTMKFPAVSLEVLPHLLRGLWESDGSMTANKSGAPGAAYSTTSCCFANSMVVAIGLATGLIARVITVNGSETADGKHRHESHRIAYDGAAGARIVRYMYVNAAEHMRCDRKWEIAQEIMRQCPATDYSHSD